MHHPVPPPSLDTRAAVDRFDALTPDAMKMDLMLRGYDVVEQAIKMRSFSKITKAFLVPIVWMDHGLYEEDVAHYREKTKDPFPFEQEVSQKMSARFFRNENPVAKLWEKNAYQVLKNYLEQLDRDVQNVRIQGRDLEKAEKTVKLIGSDLEKEMIVLDWKERTEAYKDEYRQNPLKQTDLMRLAFNAKKDASEKVLQNKAVVQDMLSFSKTLLETIKEFSQKPKSVSEPYFPGRKW